MRFVVFGLAACLAVGLVGLSPGLRADEKDKEKKSDQAKPDPAKELAALNKEFNDAQQAFFKAYREAKTNEERQQILKEKQPKPADFADRFLKLAEAYPDTPQAGQAVGWLLSYGRGTEAGNKALTKLKEKLAGIDDLGQLQKSLGSLPAFGLGELAFPVAEKVKKKLEDPKAAPLLMWVLSATLRPQTPEQGKLYDATVDLLMERFADRPELEPLTNYLPMDTNPTWAEKHLRTLMEKNSSNDVKLEAKMAVATMLNNKGEASQPEAEKMLETVVDELAKNPAKKQLFQRAKSELDDIKIRGIGKPVPEIAGIDLDDKEFKLSDYKGKVVLIDFWGFW